MSSSIPCKGTPSDPLSGITSSAQRTCLGYNNRKGAVSKPNWHELRLSEKKLIIHMHMGSSQQTRKMVSANSDEFNYMVRDNPVL